MHDEFEDQEKNLLSKLDGAKRYIMLGVGLLALVIGYNMVTWKSEEGYQYIYQNYISGETSVVSKVGLQFRVPFLSSVTPYKQVATIAFDQGSEESDNGANTTRGMKPISVTFADTYNGDVPATFRFRLPAKEDEMMKIHGDFRSFENLVDALLVRNARNVTVVTATQYTGEEFFQGGLNKFKRDLEDQLRNGLFETERQQVEVETSSLQPVGAEQEDNDKPTTQKQLVWKNVVMRDDNGLPLRQDNPLSEYGIEATQVVIGKPIPEKTLTDLLSDKKRLVAKRISTIQAQETKRAEAKTAQIEREISRTQAVAEANKQRELAVIQQQKRTAIEKENAKREQVQREKEERLALIDKRKERQIAEEERNIQKARAEAAKFEAEAIKAKGLAEAEVTREKYAALAANPEIYMAEIRRDIADVMYSNLSDFRVQMPTNYVAGGEGNGKLTSNLDVLTAYGALGIMDKAGDKVRTGLRAE